MKTIGLLLGVEPHGGGMFQYNQTMLEALIALQDDNYSVVVGYRSKLWSTYLKTRGVRSLYIHKGFWGRALWKIWRTMNLSISTWRKISPCIHPLAKTLLREQCDLWIFPTQDHVSLQIPAPALTTIHDLMHRYESRFPEVSAQGEYRMREWICRNICIWSHGILVDSEVGKMQVMESYGLSEERIHVLPYTAPKYIYSQQVPADFDARYRLPKKYILYPAQFWEHKNHRRLISAVGRLKRDFLDLKLVLVGSKKKGYQSTLTHIQDLNLTDDVIILGYVPDDDMSELYRRARALVMPTFFGPTNLPPLEAFVTGCPVCISAIYGIPEQVGNAALLFNPQSIDEIADCIKQLWIDDNLCEELVKRGNQKAAAWEQKHFNERLKYIIEDILR